MQLPTEEEILRYNQSSTQRAPYLAGWFNTKELGNFNEISVDFKADYLPAGTYCSIANFDLDYSDLESRYDHIEYNHIAGYAGFQRIKDPERYNSILSFWDVFCYDSAGKMTKNQAKQIVPADQEPSQFDWEGSGVFSLRDYPWEAGKWYRALLQCGVSPETGNTTIEYWVLDLEKQTWQQLYVFDLGVPNVSFKGNVAVFLENFDSTTSGEIRTMEVRNFRVHTVNDREWKSVESATFDRNYEYPGSYRYGSDGQTFWMISTGVPNLGTDEQGKVLTVNNIEEGIPYQRSISTKVNGTSGGGTSGGGESPYSSGGSFCSICGGLGDCPECFGEGYVDCPNLCSVGNCRHCDGFGYTVSYSGGQIKERKCVYCKGSGDCSRCNGAGVIECPTCHGKGDCPVCHGKLN